MNNFIKNTYKKLIVSCQAVDDEPLNNVTAITLMAKACIEGGAKALRLSQYQHIKSIQNFIKNNKLKINTIGIIKQKYLNCNVYITPTLKEVKQLISLKVDVIALDATLRKRPKESLEQLVSYIRKNHPKQLIMADCSNEQDVKNAIKLKFDMIGTTLRGYTKDTKGKNNIENNFGFIRWCTKQTNIPIILEGGVWDPLTARNALKKTNIHALVVGSAITRPKLITKKYLFEINK